MKTSNHCKRVVLAGNDGCKVVYCEDCDVAEVEIGALSLRLDVQAFNNLGEMLQEASAKLAAYYAAKSGNNFGIRASNVH